jgi:DNA-binding transcriptional MocR family regulator
MEGEVAVLDQGSLSAVAAAVGDWSRPGVPLYRALADALAHAVRRGDLEVGFRLPAERVLAQDLAVSRGTVVAAYQELRDLGLVESRRGSGTRIASGALAGEAVRPAERALGKNQLMRRYMEPRPTDVVDLALGSPPALPVVHHVLRTAALALDYETILRHTGYEVRGIRELREAIAARYTRRGLPTAADEVIVTGGAQQALALLVALLTGRGEGVIVDDATYPNLLDLVTLAGARHVPVTQDDDGPVPARLRAAAAQTGARVAYLVPTHHNPYGTVVPDRRRAALARLAQEDGLCLIDDETIAELPVEGAVPRPLGAFAPDAPIATVGSLSKLVWGGLRIGWVRADADTIARLARFRAVADLGPPVPTQLAAVALFDAGLDQCVEDRRIQLTAQLGTAEELLHARLPEWEWQRPRGGPSLWIRLPRPGANAFTQLAARHGVTVLPESALESRPGQDQHLRVVYARDPAVMEQGVERLASAWAAFRRAPAEAFPLARV